jgi:RNA-directed DNA polymerase
MAVRDLWQELCSYDNLFRAYKKARKRKTTKSYVAHFEKDLKNNLLSLHTELLFHSYSPKPLVNFTIRDPKTRNTRKSTIFCVPEISNFCEISKSDFRDRVIHHALCNIIEPSFEKSFIFDSYANRIGKGTLKAVERFDYFKRKAGRNNTIPCYVLKADIRKYFDEIDHSVLIAAIKKKVRDKKVIWLIKKILKNCNPNSKGMPLGNLTSQFFANVYLNELDYFIKHKLKVKYYIRYVDDFVILHESSKQLEYYRSAANAFLRSHLALQLHPDKTRIIRLKNKLTFLGFRIFYHHRLLKKQNINKMKRKSEYLTCMFAGGQISYDTVYDFFEGWMAYAKNANTYKLRMKVAESLEQNFPSEISSKEINHLSKWGVRLSSPSRPIKDIIPTIQQL